MMYRPSANEFKIFIALKILIALKQVGKAEPRRIGSKLGMAPSMANYLCRYLTTHGLLQKSGREKYELAPTGQEALEDAFTRTLSILEQKESEVLGTLAKIRLP